MKNKTEKNLEINSIKLVWIGRLNKIYISKRSFIAQFPEFRKGYYSQMFEKHQE